MLEKWLKKLKECNLKQLERHFRLEDFYKDLLYRMREDEKEQQEIARELLNMKVAERKNLYIYPEQVNV